MTRPGASFTWGRVTASTIDPVGLSAISGMTFIPSRAAGLDRLAAFVPHAGRAYADGRNSDPGPDQQQAVSLLSPYLRTRLLSEREVVQAVTAQHCSGSCEKFVQEVLWRTYWKGWLELRPEVWSRFTAERDALAIRGGMGGGMQKAIAAAENGTTGIDGFDDWARELAGRGYLHNHARMWFASIWIFTLRLPWAAGADFFLRHLIDADPASNTLSWRWVAGLQTAGKTYLATADNIARFTGGRFAPKGLATTAQPLSEDPLPRPAPLAPLPGFDPAAPALLLITPEDLSPEILFADHGTIRAVHAAAAVSGSLWGEQAQEFVTAATADAAQRASAAFGCPAAVAAALDGPALIAAARAAQVSTIVTAYAPVGPVADALAALAPQLAAEGIALHQRRRAWDEAFWPHATKGFFPFRERIPALLAEQNIVLR